MQTATTNATAISAALAAQAESVCRHYLPNGRREGRYWVFGDMHGSRGNSLIVRLRSPGRPGKWNDMATARGCFQAEWSDEAHRERIVNPPKPDPAPRQAQQQEQTRTRRVERSTGGGLSAG